MVIRKALYNNSTNLGFDIIKFKQELFGDKK
jgi:hypothetical protein